MRAGRAVLAAAVVVLAAGCASGSTAPDKAGGQSAQITLALANTSSSLDDVPAVRDFVRRVAALSGGAIRVRVLDNWAEYAPDNEAREVGAVASGKVDLGWVGSRVFDVIGLRSFRALSAPMLIDSYPLEDAVLRSGVPDRMLSELTTLHVAGLGVLGDGLRRPVGVRPLVSPAGWHGIGFGTLASKTQESAIGALGARPVRASGIYRLHDLQFGLIRGFELDVYRYHEHADFRGSARYLTGNVVLWPEFDVLLANPDRLAALTGQQRRWLRQAAEGAARDSVGEMSLEGNLVRTSCAGGARLADADAADLAAYRRAFAPVYRMLGRDPETRRYLAQIERLKRETGAPPSRLSPVPAGCRA